jgi:hypothetical protein
MVPPLLASLESGNDSIYAWQQLITGFAGRSEIQVKNIVRIAAIAAFLCVVGVVVLALLTHEAAEPVGVARERRDPCREDGSLSNETESVTPRLTHADECWRRIAEQIAMIRNESVAESLARLGQVNMFSWPGPPLETGGVAVGSSPAIAVTPSVETRDVHALLSNRRVLKLFEELRQMPAGEATALLNRELRGSLAQYLSIYAQDPSVNSKELSQGAVDPALQQEGFVVGPVWVIETSDPKRSTLLGSRYQVLALTWLAGVLRLSGAKDSVRSVAEAAIRQRQHLLGDTGQSAFSKQQILSKASLYNRIVLVQGLVGTAPCRKELEKMAAEKWWPRATIRVTAHDAQLSTYDLPVRSGARHADFSKGEIAFLFYSRVSDGDFEEVMRTVAEWSAK